jgi:hypothetical protein
VAYEVFQRSSIRVDAPILSVLADGRIIFNAAASRALEKAEVRSVEILWDKVRCRIALQAAEKGNKNSYSIAFRQGKSASISPKAFLTFIGWSSSRRQSVPAKWDPQRKMLEAELPARFVRGSKQQSGPEAATDS